MGEKMAAADPASEVGATSGPKELNLGQSAGRTVDDAGTPSAVSGDGKTGLNAVNVKLA